LPPRSTRFVVGEFRGVWDCDCKLIDFPSRPPGLMTAGPLNRRRLRLRPHSAVVMAQVLPNTERFARQPVQPQLRCRSAFRYPSSTSALRLQVTEEMATICAMLSIGNAVFYRPKDKVCGPLPVQ